MRFFAYPAMAHYMIRSIAIVSTMAVLLLAAPQQSAAADPPGYLLPWTGEVSYPVTQGWNTGSHNNNSTRYAYDFGLPNNTPVRASRAGTVAWRKTDVTQCYDVPGTLGNGVIINHSDGTATLYYHLAPPPNGVIATTGRVYQGALIGRSGNTGYVIPCPGGYHLHFNRQSQGGAPWATSQQVYFEEYPSLQLSTGVNYMSRNYDSVVLFAHAPVPDSSNPQNGYVNANPLLQLRPQNNAADLRNYPISGPGPIGTADGWNDDASSIHVPEFLAATLYRDIDYQGTAETFTSRDRWLPDNPIGNDSASSMRYDGVFVFEHINYNSGENYVAKAEFFQGDDNDLASNYIGDNSISSLCVGYGWRAILYGSRDFSGGQITFNAGCYPDLRIYNWNDAASSIRVMRV